MRVHQAEPASPADGANPAVGGAPVETLPVASAQDRPLAPLAHGQVDGTGGAGHQRDDRGLVPLPDDAQRTVTALDTEVLEVGGTRFADSQPVECQQHRQRGVVVVVALGREEEDSQLRPLQTTGVGGMDRRSADVLGWVGRDPPVNVGETV